MRRCRPAKGVEGKVSYFYAASQQEREDWVEAIAWCAVNSNLDNGYIVESVRELDACPCSARADAPPACKGFGPDARR